MIRVEEILCRYMLSRKKTRSSDIEAVGSVRVLLCLRFGSLCMTEQTTTSLLLVLWLGDNGVIHAE